ncbi:hypothetical protein GCM10023174_06700 [Chelativorans composti]|jgi:hypothetical protein|uniref:Uncharacterized protein n=1 Tax=Chelativorans composti TaxID=768533 RepID=A0ABW5DLT6_9HYPH
MKKELEHLAQLIREEQRRLLQVAAESGQIPPAQTLERIAMLELNIAAIENTLDETDK